MIDAVLRRVNPRMSSACLLWSWAALWGLANAQAQTTDSAAPPAAPLLSLSASTASPAAQTPLATSSDAMQPPPAPMATPMTTPQDAASDGAKPAPSVPAPPPSQAWQRLSKRQKQALAPLASSWDSLTPVQQQKWLALSRSFLQLSDEEQITLHARMQDWAALSPKARNQARFNFNSTQKLPIDNKRAQWQAYQQLSEQDKRELLAGSKTIKSAARSTRPPSPRLINPPPKPVTTLNGERATGHAAPTRSIDPKTLLPRPLQK